MREGRRRGSRAACAPPRAHGRGGGRRAAGQPSPSLPPGGRARRGSRAQRAARPATLGGSSGPGAPAAARSFGDASGGRAGSTVASARRYRAAPGPRPEILLGSPGGEGPGAIARRRRSDPALRRRGKAPGFPRPRRSRRRARGDGRAAAAPGTPLAAARFSEGLYKAVTPPSSSWSLTYTSRSPG